MLVGLAALAIVVTAGVIWFRRAFAVRIPADRTGFILTWLAGGALGVVALTQSPGALGATAAGLAIFGTAFFMFTVAISAQKGGSGAFAVGKPVPDFTAPDEHGTPFQLSSVRGTPLLLKVFRGHW